MKMRFLPIVFTAVVLVSSQAAKLPPPKTFLPIVCSVQTCALLGSRSTCLYTEPGPIFTITPPTLRVQADKFPFPTRQISCGEWARIARPKCLTGCSKECSVPRLVATNGREFCNRCQLRSASCAAGFSFYGPVCSKNYCVANGAQQPCVSPDTKKATSCFEYGKGPVPGCGLLCPQFCSQDRPCGSDGKQYCSGCSFTSASCASRFVIYGPVKCPPRTGWFA